MRQLMLVLLFGLMMACQRGSAEELIIGCESDYPPFSWEENGEPKGIVVDLVQEIVNDLGRSEKVRIYPWSRLFQMGLKTPGTLICTIARTQSREKSFKWVGEVISSPSVLLALKEHTQIQAASLDDYKKYIIGTHQNSFREKYLIKKGFEIDENLDSVHSNLLNYRKLKAGRIDFWAVPLIVGQCIIKEEGDDHRKMVRIVHTLTELPSGQQMAFSIGTPDDTVEKFRKSLQRIRADGRYDRILKKYLEP